MSNHVTNVADEASGDGKTGLPRTGGVTAISPTASTAVSGTP